MVSLHHPRAIPWLSLIAGLSSRLRAFSPQISRSWVWKMTHVPALPTLTLHKLPSLPLSLSRFMV